MAQAKKEKSATETANAATEPANAATEPAGADAEPEKIVPGLRISSRVAGFWRAGRAWNVAPVEVSLDELTPEQVVQLCNEPMLHVSPVEIPVSA